MNGDNLATDLNLILDFVNTHELRPWREDIGDPEALGEWLRSRALLAPGQPVSAAELEQAHELREAIRVLLLGHNEVEVDEAAALAVLDKTADRANLCIRFAGGYSHCEPSADGVDGALGRILGAISDLMSDGRWGRLKACRAEDCQWAFFDGAKNRSRAWCSMESCGNRAKVNAYRERHGIS
jgi:predicted RNA-binding Zn ribbon-like protein